MRKRRKITDLCLALAGIVLDAVAQRYFASYNLSDGLVLYSAATFLFVYAFRHHKAPTNWMVQKRVRMENRPWAWFILALAGVCILLSLRLFGQDAPTTSAWLLYLASVVLFVVALWAMEFTPEAWDFRQLLSFGRLRTSSRLWPPKHETVILGAILIIAAFVRLYDLGSLPFGVWYDEAVNGLEAMHILDESTYRPIYMRPTNSPAHFVFLISLAFKLFGTGIVPVRIISALFGMAMVIAAYLFGHEFFDRHLALVLAFLIAVSRWGVNFSRIGMYCITTPFFEFLILYFLLRGFRSGSSLDFAIGGIAMGFGACFYSAFYLFVPVVGLFLIHKAIAERGFWQRYHLNILIFALAALLVFAPVGQFAWQHPKAFFYRMRTTSIFKGKTSSQAIKVVRQSIRKHLLMFNYLGDPNGRHNLPGEPMLDFVTSTLFVLGFGYSLYRGLKPKYLLLVVWLLVMLCGGIFSLEFEAPQSLRSIGTLPAAYVLACVPLYLIAKEWDKAIKRCSWLLAAACCLLLTHIGWKNMHTYFQVQAKDFAVWNAFSTAETRLAYEIKRLKDDYNLYFAPVLSDQPTTRFLAPDFKDYKPFDPATVFPLRGTTEKGMALFIHPRNRAVRMLAEQYYPGVEIEGFKHPYGGPVILYTYIFDKGDIERVQGLPGTYSHKGKVVQRRDKRVDFDWREEALLPFPFDVQWEGALLAPVHGAYTLDLAGDGQLWLDGRLLEDGEIPLAEGLHTLRIRCRVDGPGKTRLLWQMPGEEALTIVPGDALYAPPVTANGLLARYFPNDNWEEPPVFARVEPLVSWYFHYIPLPRPYTVEWKGYIDIPTEGRYSLGTECLSASWLYVDGKLLVENTQPNNYLEKSIYLKEGLHEIELRFLDAGHYSHIYLYWTPPRGRREIVPMERLFPPTP